MWDILVRPVTSLVGDVINRVLPPEKMSEEDRARLDTEMWKTLMNADWKQYEKEIEDRVSARQLAQTELLKGTAITTMLAALHRPIWSFVTLGLFAWSMIGPQLGLPNIVFTEIHQNIMTTVIIFYFGGRSLEKSLTIVTNGKKKK